MLLWCVMQVDTEADHHEIIEVILDRHTEEDHHLLDTDLGNCFIKFLDSIIPYFCSL